jgi:hypothetical protein
LRRAQTNQKFGEEGQVSMAEILRTVGIIGFDPSSEPTIREMSDGSLEVWFEFMPPSDVERQGPHGLGQFAELDREMSAAAVTPVVWEDREFFRIESASPGALERLQAFLEAYRSTRPGLAIKSRPTQVDFIVDSDGRTRRCT